MNKITEIESALTSIETLNTKLLVLVTTTDESRRALITYLINILGLTPINLSLLLATCLAAASKTDRPMAVRQTLRQLSANSVIADPLLLVNLELMFAPSLQTNPLEVVRNLARSRPVVMVWPGELRGDRLVYADMSHPEHRDYSRDGVVVLEI